ncbi:PREDICTED: aminopeptidase N-like [Priapulus caudatus]|uniref:Aminopeptidase N-like n=1 Tax=Priapulus caudatus TaxID=37621 RepID=A0ABM1EVF3_PRICU|nr:PREDICTED: aminopeptidase N-like [Priapulus caudatus]
MATSAHTNPAYDGVDIETSKYEDTSIATDGSCDNLSFKSAPGCELSVVATTLLGVVCVALIVAIGLIVGLTAPACPLPPPAPTFPPWTDTRLPENLLPIHYDVELQPFLPPAGDFELKGSVRIRFRVAKATSIIILSCDQIKLDKSSIEVKALSADVAQPTYVDAKVDADNMYCFIIVEGELQADKEYSVFMKFQGVINDGLHGFYRTKYLGVNGSVE